MEIKKADYFKKYGVVKYCGDDTIIVLNYSDGVRTPTVTTTPSYAYDNDAVSYTFKAIAPPLRDLTTFFSVTRTSANYYKYFFWFDNFVDSGSSSTLKEIEDYLDNLYLQLKINVVRY